METNKIPTAKEMLHRVELLWLEESVEEDVLNFAIEFAKMHVKKALETQENKLNSECGRKFFDLTSTYPLENIK